MEIANFLNKNIQDIFAKPPSDEQISLMATIEKSLVDLSVLPQF